MKTKKELVELLKGCRVVKDESGNIVVQSIMNMQLVCLTTDKEFSLDERFANPFMEVKASTVGYGNLIFKNESNKEVIMPTQLAIITKQSAQNHGMVKSAYIPKSTTVRYDDAGCIEGTQTGYIKDTNGDDMRLIPVSMREMLFDKVGTHSHGNIYPAIEKLGKETKSDTGYYLDKYFKKYDKKLEQFIAHFERPKNLIGTIVLIDGEIVAIDKFPSFTYAEQVWGRLIRDCYGSLAIISELKGKNGKKYFTEEYSKITSGDVLNRIETALNNTKKNITKSVEDKIKELLELSFDSTLDSTGNPSDVSVSVPKSYILNHSGYIGQVITEENYHHMVSIVKRERFNPESLRRVTELRAKSRKQSNFSI